MSRRKHREVTIRHVDMRADVDEGVAPIILETWRAGLRTEESCQGRYDTRLRCKRAFIFLPATDAEAWLKIVSPRADDHDELWSTRSDARERELDLYFDTPEGKAEIHRRCLRTGFSGPRRERWDFFLLPFDTVDVSISFSVMIEFPASDMPDILARLRAHNARSRERAA